MIRVPSCRTVCYWLVTSTTRIEQGAWRWWEVTKELWKYSSLQMVLWESGFIWIQWWWWWWWKAACIVSPSALCSRLYETHLHQNNTLLMSCYYSILIIATINLDNICQTLVNLQSLWLIEETSIDWLFTRMGAWFSLLCNSVSMLLPKLLPSCRRFICRITAVALNACCERRCLVLIHVVHYILFWLTVNGLAPL